MNLISDMNLSLEKNMNKLGCLFTGIVIAISFSIASAKEKSSQQHGNVKLSTHLELRVCHKSSSCVGPTPVDIENSVQDLSPQTFSKGYVNGVHWRLERTQKQDGVTFTMLLNIVKQENSENYSIYMMLRTNNRKGLVARFDSRDLSHFAARTIVDDPIEIEKGSIQGSFVVGPIVSSTK
jgi:hypothetical protein